MSIHLVIVIAALVCFVLAAANFPARVNLTALGLALLTLLLLIGQP